MDHRRDSRSELGLPALRMKRVTGGGAYLARGDSWCRLHAAAERLPPAADRRVAQCLQSCRPIAGDAVRSPGPLALACTRPSRVARWT